MKIADFFPIWDKLTVQQQAQLSDYCRAATAEAGEVIHDSTGECTGFIMIRKGQLRVYINSPDGREITLYRLLENDVCLLSASCMIHSLQFDIMVEAEKNTEYLLIPAEIYQRLLQQSIPLSNYTNELMASRFSDVMWLMEHIMWDSFDVRLAAFLLEETVLEGSRKLHITHEKIANHLGTAREVVTRMLKYFQQDGLVTLSRGIIEVIDEKGLSEIEGSAK